MRVRAHTWCAQKWRAWKREREIARVDVCTEVQAYHVIYSAKCKHIGMHRHDCDTVSSPTNLCPFSCFLVPFQSLRQSPLMKLLRASIPGLLSSKELLEAVGGDGKGLADTGLSPINSNFELSLLEQELCLGMPEFS